MRTSASRASPSCCFAAWIVLLILPLMPLSVSQRGPVARVTLPLPSSSVTWKYEQRLDFSNSARSVVAKKMSWVKTMTWLLSARLAMRCATSLIRR